MKPISFAGVIGTVLLLGACGGTSEQPAAPETSASQAPPPAVPAPAGTPVPAPSPDAQATPSPAPAVTTAPAAVVAAAPPAAFNQCKVCHAVEPGKHGIGPSLAGIYGTRAGEIPGFEFSSAMKESGLVWNEANLDAYLADPRKLIPGTKMSYAGLKDAARRKEVIDYLKSL